MNQIWENGKKNSFGPNFDPFWPKFGPPNSFFIKIWCGHSLDIIVSYHHVQYQKKLMIQSWDHLVMDRRTDERTDRQTTVIS